MEDLRARLLPYPWPLLMSLTLDQLGLTIWAKPELYLKADMQQASRGLIAQAGAAARHPEECRTGVFSRRYPFLSLL